MSSKETAVKLFEQKQIRTHWDDEQEKWFFSVVDVIGVLTDSVDANAYWRKLKERLKKEGNETVTDCHALKMEAADGKMRLTDVADTEQLFRLIQSVPSKKAEPFKLWLDMLRFYQNPRKVLETASSFQFSASSYEIRTSTKP